MDIDYSALNIVATSKSGLSGANMPSGYERAIKALVKAGLVRVTRPAERVTVYVLTPAGRALHTERKAG